MILHHPFCISARMPALKIGNAWLSLKSVSVFGNERQRATFILDIVGQPGYTDNALQSGCRGFSSTQEIFSTFLALLSAAGESYMYADNAYSNDRDTNMSLFPENIVEWAAEYKAEIDSLQFTLQDAIENNVNLIEEQEND